MKNKKNIFILMFVIFLFIFFPFFTKAESLNFLSIERTNQEINLSDQIIVKFYINQKDKKSTTALSGEINFESSFLEIEEIITGNSIFPLWIEKPKEKSPGLISFSGIATGGFETEKGEIFSVIFKTKQVGSSEIKIMTNSFLKNNGEETQIDNSIKKITIKKPNDSAPYKKITINDSVPPLEFSPIIIRNLGSKGSVSLVFETIDRETGLSHFEILFSPIKYEAEEVSTNKDIIWKETQSPLFLTKQQQQLNIYLRAVDKAGNKRTVVIPPIDSYDQPNNNWLLLTFLICSILLIFIFKKKWGLRIKKQDEVL